jgi:hypothetical protein
VTKPDPDTAETDGKAETSDDKAAKPALAGKK